MSNDIHIFIGWSGDVSQRLAHELQKWIPNVIPIANPKLSRDIPAGADWNTELKAMLAKAKFAILCLTRENRNAPWIHYEAGFLVASNKVKVCPYILDFDPKDLTGPLSQLQAKYADEADTLAMLININTPERGQPVIPKSSVEMYFKLFWPQLDMQMNELREQTKQPIIEQGTSKARLNSAAEFLKDMSGVQRKLPEVTPKGHVIPVGTKIVAPVARRKAGESYKLEVVNPSSYPRGGRVAVLWEPIYKATRIPPEELIVSDAAGNQLFAQVAPADLAEAIGPQLLFILKEDVRERNHEGRVSPYLVHLTRGKPEYQEEGDEPRVEVEWSRNREPRRVTLAHNRLEVRLELFPSPWDNERNWYAGAASSVLLDGTEMLTYRVDPFDYETRCMQIDEVYLIAGEEKLAFDKSKLIKQPYQLIADVRGPVRASVIVATQPLVLDYAEFGTRKKVPVAYQLFRKISLHRGENFLEEVFSVRRVSPAPKGVKGSSEPTFEVSFFSYINLGLDPYKLTNLRPEWLGIGSAWAPYPGYGFAASAPVSSFENPHRKFPKPEHKHKHKTFSWVIDCHEAAKCLHLFMNGKSTELRALVDSVWYENIGEPLYAISPAKKR